MADPERRARAETTSAPRLRESAEWKAFQREKREREALRDFTIRFSLGLGMITGCVWTSLEDWRWALAVAVVVLLSAPAFMFRDVWRYKRDA